MGQCKGQAQDAGLSGQALSWMQGHEDRVFHRIVQRKENKRIAEQNSNSVIKYHKICNCVYLICLLSSPKVQ